MATKFPPPNYVNPESIGWRDQSCAIVTIVAAICFVVARVLTKLFITHAPGWDDYTSVIALCFAIARTGVEFDMTKDKGIGLHVWDLKPWKRKGLTVDIQTDGVLYYFCLMFAKLSILILLYRIFSVHTKFRMASFAVGAIIIGYSTTCGLMSLFRCAGVKDGWIIRTDEKGHRLGSCLDHNKLAITYGWFNIFTDMILLFMPMPLVWNLNQPLKQRFGVSCVFATGGFVCALSIVRVANSYLHPQEKDYTWRLVQTYIFYILEMNVGIIVGCLPVLQPLFRRTLPSLKRFFPISLRSAFSNHSLSRRGHREPDRKPSGPAKNPNWDIELAEQGSIPVRSSENESEHRVSSVFPDQSDKDLLWTGRMMEKDSGHVHSGGAGNEPR